MEDRAQILEKIFQQTEDILCDEETMKLLLRKKYTKFNYSTKASLGQKAADKVANIAGSWGFIITFGLILCLWMYVNIKMIIHPFDPFPFVLLNLVLSCISAFQAPLIMMSQNRQDEIDRYQAKEDYIINLKTEVIIEDMYQKIEKIMIYQEDILKILKQLDK